MLKEIHAKGKWTLELEETGSDPSVETCLATGKYTALYGFHELTGSVASGMVVCNKTHDEFPVPESILTWAERKEDEFFDRVNTRKEQ